MPTVFRDVRFQGQSGKHLLALSFSGFDPKATSGSRRAQPHFRQQHCPSCERGEWSFIKLTQPVQNRPTLEVEKGKDARLGRDS
jgi:hypothetical protein